MNETANKLILKTNRLTLQACDEEILQGLIDNNLVSFGLKLTEGWPLQETKEALPTFLAMMKSGECPLGWGMWIIIHQKKVIGGIGFVGKPNKSGSVELGYGLAPEFRRRGLTYEACQTLIKWAFANVEVKTVRITCEQSNIASIKLIEKLGMKFLKFNKKHILEYFLPKDEIKFTY